MSSAPLRACLAVSCTLLVLLLSPPAARAALTFQFELTGQYDDNVIGLLSDAPSAGGGGGGGMMGAAAAASLKGGMNTNPGMPGGGGASAGTGQDTGDFSTNLYADIGTLMKHEATSFLLLASVDRTDYRTFTDLDATIGTASAAVTRRFTDDFSGTVAVRGAVKDFRDDLRDSRAYGGRLELKERFGRSWLKAAGDLERNSADSAFYSYDGRSLALRLGIAAGERSELILGYRYLVRDYDEPSSFRATEQAVSAGWRYDLDDRWSVSIGYARQAADSTLPDTRTVNNSTSGGIRYAY